MPIVGGNNVAYGSGGYYEAQIVYSVDYPTATTYSVDWQFRVYHSTSLVDSTNEAGNSNGDLKANTSYGSKSYNSGSSGYMVYASGTKTGTRPAPGGTLTLAQNFWVEDLANSSGGGARSTVEVSFGIDDQAISAPTAPGTPTVSSVQATTATQSWADPGNWNGENSSDFDVQRATNSTFTTGVSTVSVLNANTYGWTGLTGNTRYWVRERAKNSAGEGPFSPSVSFLTKPSTPPTVFHSAVKTTEATLGCSAPAGGAATYRLHVAADAGFTDLVLDLNDPIAGGVIGSLTPDTQYWYRFRAENATGASGWSTVGTFTTLSNVYVRDGGVLKASEAYVRDGGVWKPCEAYVWRSGAWRL